ncbi:MAG: HRDC domain-containing protein [Pseudomonadota bacterium]|nr:HRDC domain-containing protein [Pseudomonadota bacterium]
MELKNVRKRLAKENRVPPYLIFHDTTLIEMAGIMPTTEALMLQVRGVGLEPCQLVVRGLQKNYNCHDFV